MSKKVLWVVVIIILIIVIAAVALNRPSSSEPTTSAPKESINPDSVGTSTNATSSEMSAKTYTLDDVASHGTKDSCWTAIDGTVYDLTSFIDSHPGGVENIMKICGIDGTAAFRAQHDHGKRQAAILETLKIGVIAQ